MSGHGHAESGGSHGAHHDAGLLPEPFDVLEPSWLQNEIHEQLIAPIVEIPMKVAKAATTDAIGLEIGGGGGHSGGGGHGGGHH